MSTSITVPAGVGVFHLPLEFALRGAQLAFELTGPAQAPVVAVAGGISAHRHVCATAFDPAPGWWEPCVGAGRAIDTQRFRVLAVDWLGGQGASTGPTNTTAARAFPLVTADHQAQAIALLLAHLGIERLHGFVGASFGGMVGLCLAAAHPARIGRLIAIAAAHESHPLASAWRSVQRRIVRLGLRHGAAAAQEALTIARALAMTTYRSAAEFGRRFAGPAEIVGQHARFPVDAYLDARGREFAARCSASTFLSLSYAIDVHRVPPEQITTPVTLVGVTSDALVPITQVRELARRLAGPVRLVELDSIYGHDAFLKEVGAIAAILRGDLAGPEAAP